MGLAHVPPEVELQLVILLHLDWFLEREEYGEPGEHAGGVCGGEDADHDLLVEVALEISSETMQHRVSVDVEAELGVPGVVDGLGQVWMIKGEQRLGWSQLKTILQRKRTLDVYTN